jgi:hypothetical protein
MHIAYEREPCAPTETVLELCPDGCTLTFPLSKPWVAWSASVMFLGGAVVIAVGLTWELCQRGVQGASPAQLGMWAFSSATMIGSAAIGAREGWMLRRYGGLPRCVRVASGEIWVREERRPGWRRRRLAELTRVRVRPQRPWLKVTGAVVDVEFGQWRRSLAWWFPAEGIKTAEQFAEHLRQHAATGAA